MDKNPLDYLLQEARRQHASSPPVFADLVVAALGEFARGPFLSPPDDLREAEAVLHDDRFTPAQKVARVERLRDVADGALFRASLV